MRLLILALLIGAITACSSNLKKGNNMMEAEQYDEAVRYYEKALQEDPGDTEVATKLYEARTRMVMANLIKVRLQRQSNQHRAAALQLNSTLRNIKRWQIMADSGVKATIEEEVLESSKWLDSELTLLGGRGDHNRFYYSLKQFNYILDSGYADRTVAQFKPQMQDQGQTQCRAMRGQLTPQSAYLHDNWLAYCGAFGLQVSYPLQKDSSLYSRPSIAFRQLRVSKDAGIESKEFAEGLEREIRSHPWFSNWGSQVLPFSMSGRVFYNLKAKPKVFKKTVMVYDETLELIKDPKDPEKIIRKLIQKKKVPKTVTFKGVEYEERYAHKVAVKSRSKQVLVDAATQRLEQKTLSPSHTTYFKEEGIRPLKVSFLNKQTWERGMTRELVSQIRRDLDRSWISNYCTDQDIAKGLSQNEYAARCALLRPGHAVVNAWSESEFSLTFGQLQVLLSNEG